MSQDRRSKFTVGAVGATLGILVSVLTLGGFLVSWLADLGGSEPHLRAIVAFDTSVSMLCPVDSDRLPHGAACPSHGKIPPFDGQSRIEAALNDGVKPGLGYFEKGDAVAVWRFGGKIDRPVIHGFSSPERYADQLSDIRPAGGTRLYETIFDAVTELRKSKKPDTVRAVLVITDGTDNGSVIKDTPLPKEMDPLRKNAILEGALGKGDPDRPVYVLLTAAYDVACDDLLSDIDRDVFRLNCYGVDDAATAGADARTIQDAYDDIQARLDELTHRTR